MENDKDRLLIDLINKSLPDFSSPQGLTEIKHILKKYPHAYNIPYLIEETLAYVGNLKLVRKDSHDFDDLSDAKTSTLSGNRKLAEISGLDTKIGALRILIANPFTDTVDFFFVNFNDWSKLTTKKYKNGISKLRLRLYYNESNDSYGQFEQFRLKTIEELALKRN